MSRATQRLTLTEFMDVVNRSGVPKATAVRRIKENDTYSPVTDFYKPLREHIVELHTKGKPKSELKAILATLTDEKKLSNYPAALGGYSKWWGTKTFSWFRPPSTTISRHGVELSVTPELGLVISGVRHVIKLFIRGEALPQNRADVVLRLMASSLTPQLKAGDMVAVLDVRRGKLLTLSGKAPATILDALLDGELAYIASLWPSV